MKWVETDDGYLNLDHALEIVGPRDGDYYITDIKGKHHHALLNDENIEAIVYPIIPESRNIVLYKIWYSGDGSEPDVFVEQFPVIGWRYLCGIAVPIIPLDDIELHNKHVLSVLKMPDGRFYEARYEGNKFDTLDAAKDCLRDQFKALREDHVARTTKDGR